MMDNLKRRNIVSSMFFCKSVEETSKHLFLNAGLLILFGHYATHGLATQEFFL